MMKDNRRQLYLLLFILALAVNFSGIGLGFFTDDPGLYASISKNLVYRKEFWQLFTYNQDWLDKPHFPFWMVMLSFKLFGISVWAYRLPALLFFLLGLRYTWLFAKKFYNEEIAWIAVLIVSTSLHVVMSNTDVRAEPYLLALIIGSIYHISKLEEKLSIADLLLAALLTACAIMTKGIFVIVAIYGALFIQFVFKRKFPALFRWKWILMVVLTCIFILPELYALYTQFDLHPEKTVFGRHHVSGIRWFFWDSQFGRFVNNGPITRQSGDIFFYVHTLLWAFAPWGLVFYYAIYSNLKQMIRRKQLAEYYSLGGGLLLLLLFSFSGFQLPFYTNIIFPLFAIITAPFCYNQLSTFGTYWRAVSLWVYVVLLIVLVPLVHFLSAPGSNGYFVMDCILLIIMAGIIFVKVDDKGLKAFTMACTASLFVNLYLNTVFYKMIIRYRAQIGAAEYVNKTEPLSTPIFNLSAENNVFQFYLQRPAGQVATEDFKNVQVSNTVVFFANQKAIDSLKNKQVHFKEIKAFAGYPSENISPDFINKNTRSKTLDSVYLISK